MFYEIMYIVPNNYSEDEVKGIKNKIKDLAGKEGFEVVKEETMGKRKLSYPIKQNYFGYYELTYLKNENEGKLAILSQKIKILPEILRHQIIKYKAMPVPTVAANIINNPNEVTNRKHHYEKQEEVSDKPVKTEPARAEEKKESKKVDLNDLDKKLDELLGDVDV
ncbi:MAG: 30S ribosomal protein S6 [bacterium]